MEYRCSECGGEVTRQVITTIPHSEEVILYQCPRCKVNALPPITVNMNAQGEPQSILTAMKESGALKGLENVPETLVFYAEKVEGHSDGLCGYERVVGQWLRDVSAAWQAAIDMSKEGEK